MDRSKLFLFPIFLGAVFVFFKAANEGISVVEAGALGSIGFFAGLVIQEKVQNKLHLKGKK